jgi:hypothetical protein
MPTWITTTWMYRTFGQTKTRETNGSEKWSKGYWAKETYSPDYENLSTALSDLQSYCNANQFSIKAMIPLTQAAAYEYGQAVEYSTMLNGVMAAAGIGYGWGYSNIVGFAALLERVEQISDEEYERRRAAVDTEPSLAPA